MIPLDYNGHMPFFRSYDAAETAKPQLGVVSPNKVNQAETIAARYGLKIHEVKE